MTEAPVAESSTSSIPRRTLGIALRRAREAASPKITMQAAADRLGQSVLSVRRIEQGAVSTPAWKVEKLCELYGVPDPTRDVLLELAKETRAKGWWHSYGDAVPGWFELYVTLEATASRLRIFDPVLVPGLLQHPDYIGAVIGADLPELGEQETAARIALRQSRQALLTRSFPQPPEVQVIIGESVLLAELDGIRAQVWHLLKATELPTVSVRVLPMAAGPVRGAIAGAWTLLDFPGENGSAPPPSTVYMENLTGAVYLDRPEELAAYELVWAAQDRAALSQPESIALMGRRLKELTERER
ncbi:MAG: hypothetical protein QOH97_1183 [Actinoplanes sp.]|nr:hypothetical protein [Actinoplanes sp.]